MELNLLVLKDLRIASTPDTQRACLSQFEPNEIVSQPFSAQGKAISKDNLSEIPLL